MGIVAVMALIFTVPFIWLAWSAIDVGNGKKEKIDWKKPSILLFIIIALVGAMNYYFYHTYQLPLLPNFFEGIIGLIVTGAIVFIIAIVNIIVSITHKGAPKSVHNPKAVWAFAGILGVAFLLLFSWVYPTAQKAAYVQKIETAMHALSESETDKEVTVLFMNSEKNCVRRRTQSCSDEDYQNYFFVKNNLEEEKEVQVKIRALNADKEELKVVDSNIMTLGAGELRLVETEETNDKTSIWSKSTFETEYQTYYYEYKYRFRDPSEN